MIDASTVATGSRVQDHIWAHRPDGTRVTNLADIVRRPAAPPPDAVAINTADEAVTFAELDARSARVAPALRADGVVAGDRVTYLGGNTPSFLEAIYRPAKLEATATSLNNRLARGEIETILGAAEPRVLVLVPASRSCRRPAAVPAPGRYDQYESWQAGPAAVGSTKDRTDRSEPGGHCCIKRSARSLAARLPQDRILPNAGR